MCTELLCATFNIFYCIIVPSYLGSMAMVKAEVQQINENVYAVYELLLENGDYAISCEEINKSGAQIDYCYVGDITRDKEWANRIFDVVVKNKVCACTLLDVICDLIC